jgi:hypothetical protein
MTDHSANQNACEYRSARLIILTPNRFEAGLSILQSFHPFFVFFRLQRNTFVKYELDRSHRKIRHFVEQISGIPASGYNRLTV